MSLELFWGWPGCPGAVPLGSSDLARAAAGLLGGGSVVRCPFLTQHGRCFAIVLGWA